MGLASLIQRFPWIVDLDPRPCPRAAPNASARGVGCLALAQLRGLPAMTADRAWCGLEVGIEVRTIR